MILRLIRRARHYYPQLAIATVGLLAAAVLNLLTPEIVRRLTAFLTSDEIDAPNAVNIILTLSGILVAAYILRMALKFCVMYYAHVAAWNYVGELILAVYDKFQSLSLRYYHDKQTGQLMSRAVNDTRILEQLIAHSLPDLLSNFVVVITVAIALFTVNVKLAALALIPVPLVLFSGVIFSKVVSPLFKINQKTLGELSGSIQDDLSGMKEIQAFGAEDYIHARMAKDCKYYSYVNIRANKVNAVFSPAVEFLCSMATVIVVGAGGILAVGGSLSVSDIVAMFMYLSLFYSPLTVLARLFEDVQSALAGAERVFEVLDSTSDVPEAADAVNLERANGDIEFKNVSFSYNPGGDIILDSVNLNIKHGEMVAFVGPTGVGKTTAVSLIERFYDPTSGEILLDGHDLRSLTVKSVRANISMVLQDVFLFNGTIAENIALGMPSATRAQIEAAAVTAYADEFIRATPDGYDTVVGERGMRLSGGQKQRISIARAVLRNTPVLILDEATSSVDPETEADIAAAINSLAGTRTIIIIAHRLSTVRRADRIVVLENAQIAEQGTHGELVQKGGVYAKMCSI